MMTSAPTEKGEAMFEFETFQEDFCDKREYCSDCPMAHKNVTIFEFCIYEEMKRRLELLNGERKDNERKAD